MSLDGGASKAAKIEQQTANTNNAFAQSMYNQNRALEQPTIDRGNAAGTTYNALLGLGGDSTAANQAFQNFQNSDGYQFRLNQGLSAVNASAAAKGGLLSGATLKGLNDYASGSASSEFGKYLSDLSTPMTLGQSAAGTVTGAGQNLVTSTTANNNQAAQAASSAALASGSGLNSLIGTGVGLASSFGLGGTSGILKFLGGKG